jgi:hypothetical protein
VTGILASAFTGLLADWLFRTFVVRWRSVMRYRSATVADSHGLPLNLERNKERRTCAESANAPALRNLFVCAFLAIGCASHALLKQLSLHFFATLRRFFLGAGSTESLLITSTYPDMTI